MYCLYRWSHTCFSTAKRVLNHYQILEVPRSATTADVRRNYIKLAKIYHPDVYKGPQKDKFNLINQAYDVLSDAKKKSAYDRCLEGSGLKDSKTHNPQDYSQAKQSEQQGNQKNTQSKFNYQQESTEEGLDIDAEYSKFMNKDAKTRFEEINLRQDDEFKAMSEQERVRRRFTQVYQDIGGINKMSHQKSFEGTLDDQIDQRNEHIRQKKKQADKLRWLHSQKVIESQKKALIIGTVVFTLVGLPLFTSFLTKYRIEVEEKRKIEQSWAKFEEKFKEAEVKSRFNY